MKYFDGTIEISIFKYVDNPLNLTLTCQNRTVIGKDANSKAEWLTAHHGKAHDFIFISIRQALIARIISRCFVRLLKYIRSYDQRLIELKVEHLFDTGRNHAFKKKIKFLWESNLPIFLSICQSFNAGKDSSLNRNDMKLFKFLTIGPEMLRRNLKEIDLKEIEYVILNKWLSRPKPELISDPYAHQPIPEERENNKLSVTKSFLRQENVLSRQCLFSDSSPTSILTNNIRISERNVNRRRLRRQRPTNKSVQFNDNNQDALNRIANLPRQFTNDQLINQFFNGTPFF